MADFKTIKTIIDVNINTNGNQAITGAGVNYVLKQMVDASEEQFVNLSEKASAQDNRIGLFETEVRDEVSNFKHVVAEQVESYKPIEINGDVTNAADEEDLTSENNLLKLKNRNSINGLGYVILRKNKSLAEQLVLPNTIYEVRYNFIIDDEIDLPQNAIIKFNGGKFEGGTIKMDNTDFENLTDDVFNGVGFKGSTKTKKIKASFFSIHPTEKENIINIQTKLNCLSEFVSCMTEGVCVSFESGYYGFGGETKQPMDLYLGSQDYALYRNYALYINTPSKDVIIEGNGATFINMVDNHYGCWDVSVSPFVAYTSANNINNSKPYHTMGGGIVYLFSRIEKNIVRINNINGDYNEKKTLGGNTFISSTQSGFEIGDDIQFLSIKNCNITNNITDAINITGICETIEIDNCSLSNSGRSNLSVSDTSVSVSITNCNFINSGDWDKNLNFRWEGVGAAINLEPIKAQSGRAEISNCLFDRFAYTAISMGATQNNSFDVVSIKGCRFENDKLARTISNNKVTTLSSVASCCVGRVNKEVMIFDSSLLNTAIALEKFQQTQNDNSSFEYVRLNRLSLSVSSEFYILYGSKLILGSDFYQLQPRRKIIADNIYVCVDNGAAINIKVDATISGVAERDNSIYVGNVYCLLNDHNTYGGVSATSEIIENLYLVNFEKLTASYTKADNQISKACKNIYYFDAANSGYVPFMIDSTRTIRHAPMKNVGKLASNNIDVNFINLSNDSWRTILFGCAGTQNTISFLPNNSVIVRDPSYLQGEQLGTLFALISNDSKLASGKDKYFYGVRKGLPYGAADLSSISGYTPEIGEMCFDKVNKKPYWWNGSNWVDANGDTK